MMKNALRSIFYFVFIRVEKSVMNKINAGQNQPFNILDKPENGLFDAADYLRASLSNKDDLRLVHLEENAESNSGEAEAEQRFWVEKSLDAKVLSRRLLVENFNFDAEDIKAFEAKYGEFVITDAKKCEIDKKCTAATAGDIKNWKTVNNRVAIDLSEASVKRLHDFRRERVIGVATDKIADPFTCQTVRAELLVLATGEGQSRIDAAEKLSDLDVATFDDLEAVRNSIRTIAAQTENKNNGALQVLAAKVDLQRAVADRRNAFNALVNSTGNEKNAQYQTIQKRVSAYENQLQKAIDAASGIDAQTGKRPPNAKINRIEAAWANRELADIYRQTGDAEKAAEREMLMRIYQIDERERNTTEFKIGTPRVGLDGTIFSSGWFPKIKTPQMRAAEGNVPPPAAPSQPQKKDLNEAPFKFQYKVVDTIDNQGKIIRDENSQKLKDVKTTYQIEGSLKTSDKMTISSYEYFDERGRKVPEGMPYKIRNERQTTISPPELNKSGTTRASVRAGGVGALQEFNNWFPVVVDVLLTNKSLNNRLTKEASQREAFLQNNYPIPPEPKDLPRIKLRLEQQYGKEAAAVLMKKIEEMSYAAWGSQ